MLTAFKRLAVAAVALFASAAHAADAPKEIRLDYAYYSPPSLVLKRFGWLEQALKPESITVKWVLSQAATARWSS